MSHENASVKSIIFALSANLGIAITKTVAAVITSSGSMLAESIHSFADCGNQLLLFLGLKQSKHGISEKHPLGHGKEIYFWSFIVALILFSMGGLFSIYEGIHKLSSHEELKNPIIAVVVIALSICLEGASLLGCLGQIKKVKSSDTSVAKWVKHTRKSELVVILGEDIAALLGLTLALIAIVLTWVTGNPIFDACGSISIGALLVLVSIFIGIKVKGLLIGESADPETQKQITDFLESRSEIEEIYNTITIQLGAEIMLAVKVKMKNTTSAQAMIEDINNCESDLHKLIPNLKWIFFEPDVRN